MDLFWVVWIPFFGTALGSAGVFFLKNNENERVLGNLTGFTAGIMTAASVWSLLLPALEQAEGMGKFAFVPAVSGLLSGVLFLLLWNRIVPQAYPYETRPEKTKGRRRSTAMLVFAVTLHNIPEGMAVGAVYAAYLSQNAEVSAATVIALCVGIALQNVPEGTIISMPLRTAGMRKGKAFVMGVLSGAVEPAGMFLTVLAVAQVVSVLPFLLGFAAGAMLLVVVEELIPQMSQGRHPDAAAVFFAVGFAVMMTLDVTMAV